MYDAQTLMARCGTAAGYEEWSPLWMAHMVNPAMQMLWFGEAYLLAVESRHA